jgi:hypothetical protein
MFKINGEDWGILSVPSHHPMLLKGDGTYSVAACDDPSKTIYVNNLLEGDLLRRVICHEVTHAAMFSYDVSLTIDQEELLADLIATYGAEIIAVTNQIFGKIQKRV